MSCRVCVCVQAKKRLTVRTEDLRGVCTLIIFKHKYQSVLILFADYHPYLQFFTHARTAGWAERAGVGKTLTGGDGGGARGAGEVEGLHPPPSARPVWV